MKRLRSFEKRVPQKSADRGPQPERRAARPPSAFALDPAAPLFCLVSHKLLRWFFPCFCSFSLASSLLLELAFLPDCGLASASFYALAACAGSSDDAKIHQSPLHSLLFCLVNTAALFGIVQFCAAHFTHVADGP